MSLDGLLTWLVKRKDQTLLALPAFRSKSHLLSCKEKQSMIPGRRKIT